MSNSNTYREFHISRKARDKFRFEDTFFSMKGNVIFSDPLAAQAFSTAINERQKRERRPPAKIRGRGTSRVTASDVYAMGLYHEVLHFVIASYVEGRNPGAFAGLEKWLKLNVGEKDLQRSELSFVDLFPPTSVYKGQESPADFIDATEDGIPRTHLVLEELILLWLENRNPAFVAVSDLVDDSDLRKKSAYQDVLASTDSFFDTQPKYGPANSSLMKMLLAPIEASPDSIMDQLQFMATNWEDILGKSPLLMKLLRAVDFIKEEGKYFLMLAQAQADRARIPNVRGAGFEGFGERGSEPVMRFRGSEAEYEAENFSQDLGWMPRLVLIAKNAFVWLDQLSRKYGRSITRLDQVPDEELEELSRRGFTGLWLIGVWIRSAASQKIKHLNGNRDAIASAYSLHAYDIAGELGGEEAYRNLRDRAGRFGVRLASDMVPNHMGIDSTWLLEHPDWFLQSGYPPYANYSFSGPDLSSDERVGVFIEDGYWSKRDAAVVFKRLDRWTGDARYIYHGNDGTHMPWNDTAQLDFTKPEVREAVIQTILHVARMFPIIRFDAAMVLSKKHYQRLWFPEPGTGGAIPSRSNFSMTREQFDAAIPVEFWREVVDRVQKEAPDTLLLAEAFWLMEGYFVRTLGMHRVYNSAFMNMLKREENSGYRQVIKNVLEYNPQILKRFVNFVNNPDEDTAIAQFGKDDKYFGVCVLMATMPGLPMFGHGQIEGYTEKYGMEFRRAYREENPDQNLVSRHEREIFPLLRLRHHFSEVDRFLLYDFFTGEGTVNEDVFAYSNATGSERNLVVYNNRYTHTAGWIKTSVGFLGDGGNIAQKNIADGLSLASGKNGYVIFRDVINGVEYIRPTRTLKKDGLFIELGAYKYNVFMDFREVHSTKEMPYDELCKELDGRGVNSIDEELFNLKLKEVHAAFYEAINPGSLGYLMNGAREGRVRPDRAKAFDEKISKFYLAAHKYRHSHEKNSIEDESPHAEYSALLSLQRRITEKTAVSHISKILAPFDDKSLRGWRVMFLWLFLRKVARRRGPDAGANPGPVGEFRLLGQIRNCFKELGVDRGTCDYEANLVEILLLALGASESEKDAATLDRLMASLKLEPVQAFIAVHTYDGTRWFNKERFEDVLGYFVIAAAVEYLSENARRPAAELRSRIQALLKEASALRKSAAKCSYRFDEIMRSVQS